MVWIWFVLTKTHGEIQSPCGSFGRWSIVACVWVVGVDSHEWLGATIVVVSEFLLLLDWISSCGND